MEDLTPQQKAAIEANVAKMVKLGYSPEQIDAYRKLEAGQITEDAVRSIMANGPALVQAPESMGKGLARQAGMGATYNLGDEFHVPGLAGDVNKMKMKQFEQDNPVKSFFAKLGGMALAPAVATMAAPALASAGGAVALGGAGGLLAGYGEGEGGPLSEDRLHRAAVGGTVGMPAGLLGYGAAKVAGAVGRGVLERFNPDRAVARAAQGLFEGDGSGAAEQASMDAINAHAPGGASIASVTKPNIGQTTMSRFNETLAKLSGGTASAMAAEGDIKVQQAALEQGLKGLGAQIQARESNVAVTPALRKALAQARSVISKYVPDVPEQSPQSLNPLGLEQSQPFTFGEDITHLTTTQLHDMLSRLRFSLRNMEKFGAEPNGQTLHDFSEAAQGLTKILYHEAPSLKPLDMAYSNLSDQLRTTDKMLKVVQPAIRQGGAGELPGTNVKIPTKHNIVTDLIERIFVDKKGQAAAIQRALTKPGGADAVASLLKHTPANRTILGVPVGKAGAAAHGLFDVTATQAPGAAVSPTTAGLLAPPKPQEQEQPY